MINLQALINDAVDKRSQSRSSQRDKDYFHCSDAGTCYRKRFYKRLGVEPVTDIHVGSLKKMLAGDAGHEMLQHTLKYYGNLFAAEGEVLTDHIKGHFDAIVKDGQEKVLVEFKTVEKWSMTHIKGTCSCRNSGKPCQPGPKDNHITQMFTYWYLMRRDYTHLNQATLFYVKREDFEGIAFDYLWDDAIEAKVKAEWTPLVNYWVNKQLPPCTCHLDYGGSGVKYCRYIEADGESCCSERLFQT